MAIILLEFIGQSELIELGSGKHPAASCCRRFEYHPIFPKVVPPKQSRGVSHIQQVLLRTKGVLLAHQVGRSITISRTDFAQRARVNSLGGHRLHQPGGGKSVGRPCRRSKDLKNSASLASDPHHKWGYERMASMWWN